jgi:hypothetical protein
MSEEQARLALLIWFCCWLFKQFLIWCCLIAVCCLLNIDPGHHWIIKTVLATTVPYLLPIP